MLIALRLMHNLLYNGRCGGGGGCMAPPFPTVPKRWSDYVNLMCHVPMTT